MFAILKAYLDIVRLRQGPASLPYSPALLLLTILALSTLSLLVPSNLPITTAQAAVIYGFDILMNCSVIWLLLNAMNRTNRFVQTMTALFGAKLVLSLAQVGVQALFEGAVSVGGGGEPSVAATFVLVGIEIWYYVVMSAILRAALSVSVLQSIGLILLISLLLFGALGMVLPDLAGGR